MFKSDTKGESADDGGALAVLIARAGQSAVRAVETELAPFGVSASQYMVLNLLSNCGDTTVGHLARLSGMDSGAMTRMLDRMEAGGVLVRQPDHKDRRVIRLALTQHGSAILPQLNAAAMRVHGTLVRGYSGEDLDRFRDYLLIAIRNALSSQEAV